MTERGHFERGFLECPLFIEQTFGMVCTFAGFFGRIRE